MPFEDAGPGRLFRRCRLLNRRGLRRHLKPQKAEANAIDAGAGRADAAIGRAHARGMVAELAAPDDAAVAGDRSRRIDPGESP